MVYLIGGIVAVGVVGYLATLFARGEIRTLVRILRYSLGWGALGFAALLIFGGRVGIGSMLGLAGASILNRGRLGPIDFGAGMTRPDNISRVKSRYLDMGLDHDTGEIDGTVREGEFARADLADLDPEQSWALYTIVSSDPDSLALYETWLNAHRAGWEDYFTEHFGFDGAAGASQDQAAGARASHESGRDPLTEAYEILGLEQGASADDIRAAHRALMKKVHPDHGGSSYLASRINEAKDRLLAALAKKA